MEIVNEYISKALIADNRGGLNVQKIYNEKLKQKFVKVKQDGNQHPLHAKFVSYTYFRKTTDEIGTKTVVLVMEIFPIVVNDL